VEVACESLDDVRTASAHEFHEGSDEEVLLVLAAELDYLVEAGRDCAPDLVVGVFAEAIEHREEGLVEVVLAVGHCEALELISPARTATNI
jgi:hypothetical protein